jgi:hypothetical protein
MMFISLPFDIHLKINNYLDIYSTHNFNTICKDINKIVIDYNKFINYSNCIKSMYIKYKYYTATGYDVITNLNRCVCCKQLNHNIFDMIIHISDRIEKIHVYTCCKLCFSTYTQNLDVNYLRYPDIVISYENRYEYMHW